MKDRLITLAGGLLALYFVIALLTPPSQPEFASQPTTIDRNRHGLSLLFEWLQSASIPVRSLRYRYDELFSDAELPASGNLLVVSLPLKVDATSDEKNYLRQWLAQGNSILLLIAHSDYPEWSRKEAWRGVLTQYDMLNSLGFNLNFKDEETGSDDTVNNNTTDKDEKKSNKNLVGIDDFNSTLLKQTTLVPAQSLPATIKQIDAEQIPLATLGWQLDPRERYRGSKVLITENDSALSPAMWQVRVGSGNAIISRYADLFSNARLNKADNSRMFEYLLSQHLVTGGHVVFDDMHQGISDIYNPDAFFSDPRLYNTLWFLFGFWLLYLVGYTNRLAPPLKARPVAHAADFIRAIGGLFARRLSNPATALGLLRHFFNEVRQQYNLPMNGQPAWDTLGKIPRIQPAQLESLQHSFQHALQGQKQDLVKLHNQLRETRKCLL